MEALRNKIHEVVSNKGKLYYITLLALSFVDMIFGIISLFNSILAIQAMSLAFSSITLIALIYGIITHLNSARGRVSTLVVSVLDVSMGILSVVALTLATAVLAGIITGTTAIKTIKVVIQSEKVQKFIKSVKPQILRYLVRVAPIFIVNFINKLVKRKKGDRRMEAFKNFWKKLGNGLKNNPVTIIGSTLATGGSGLFGVWAVKHITATGLLPNWANYVVGIAIAAILYGLIEWAILGAGAETAIGAKLRKGIKNIFKVAGSDEVVAEIEKMELKANELKKEEELKKQAEKELAKEAAEQAKLEAKILKEAEEKLKAEQLKKAADEQAKKEELAKAEAELKAKLEKEAYDAKVRAKMEELKAQKEEK